VKRVSLAMSVLLDVKHKNAPGKKPGACDMLGPASFTADGVS
jgi:hypothetical protein